MRMKFLSVIASLLFASVAISSCLDSDESTYEASSDATVHAFALDEINGVRYKFTINQLNRLIYNADSLPMGADTIIDRILIDTFYVSGWITAGINDTLFVYTDSVDLTPAMNKPSPDDGMKFNIHAPDGSRVNTYTLKINVHCQDPDSLVWMNMTQTDETGKVAISGFPTVPLADMHQTVTLGEDVLVYDFGAIPVMAYRISTPDRHASYQCIKEEVKGLPESEEMTWLQGIVNFREQLFVACEGDIYASADGVEWHKAEALSGSNVQVLLAGFSNTLAGIRQEGGTTRFCVSDNTLQGWEDGNEVPEAFPQGAFCSTLFTTATGVEKVVLTGTEQHGAKATVPWFSLDGREWSDMSTTSNAFCPLLEHPSVIHYGGQFYIFGNRFETFYSSQAGLAWYEVEEKFLMPASIKGHDCYSMTVDNDHYIWIVLGGKTIGEENQLWRGRLNKLGFDRP